MENDIRETRKFVHVFFPLYLRRCSDISLQCMTWERFVKVFNWTRDTNHNSKGKWKVRTTKPYAHVLSRFIEAKWLFLRLVFTNIYFRLGNLCREWHLIPHERRRNSSVCSLNYTYKYKAKDASSWPASKDYYTTKVAWKWTVGFNKILTFYFRWFIY